MNLVFTIIILINLLLILMKGNYEIRQLGNWFIVTGNPFFFLSDIFFQYLIVFFKLFNRLGMQEDGILTFL